MRRLVLLLISCLSVARCAFVINKYNYECNSALLNLNYSMATVKGQGTFMNFTINLLTSIDSLKILMNVSLPENDNDKKYKKLVITNEYDFEKMSSNILAKTLLDTTLKSTKYEARLPFPKGVYKYVDLSMPDKIVPGFINKIRVNFRFEGTAGGKKSNEFFCWSESYCEVKR